MVSVILMLLSNVVYPLNTYRTRLSIPLLYKTIHLLIYSQFRVKLFIYMKILFVTNMYPSLKSSFGIFVREQIEEIRKSISCKSDIYYINGRDKGKMQYLISIFSIPKIIRKVKYDIIHIHYGLSALFLLFYKPKAKVFLTLHGADILEKQGKRIQITVTKKILKHVDKVFILSKEMEEVVKPLKINYEILPCGVDINFFTYDPKLEKAGRSKLVIFPGSPILEVKNYSLFEKVITYLRENSSYTIETKVVNNLSREGVKELLNTGDCLLMTSFSEGSPQIVKEALACGLPVVSVPVGDVDFMISQIPFCATSNTYNVEELAFLVSRSFLGKGEIVRAAFIEKQFYDHQSVTSRIIYNYQYSLNNC